MQLLRVSLKIIKELVGYFKCIKKSQCESQISVYNRTCRYFILLLLYTNLRKQRPTQNYQFTHTTHVSIIKLAAKGDTIHRNVRLCRLAS